MRVGELCKRPPVVIDAEASLSEAAQLMRAEHVGSLVVVKERARPEHPVGILTDRDIVVGAVAEDAEDVHRLSVADIMSAEVITARREELLFSVLEKMLRSGVRRIPVIDAEERILGLVALDDVIEVLADRLKDVAITLRNEQFRERVKRRRSELVTAAHVRRER
jgi:signal-transduction protein with cAMP-binding, CBS, and nucleotidyltransferase domain